MDYSPVYVRSSDLYITTSGSWHGSLTGDFTIEFWWKPASLNAAEDQTFFQVNHTAGGTPVRLWKTDNAGSPRLRLLCQEVTNSSPAAAEHVIVEWDISGVVSVGTWVHIAVAFDVSQAVATIAELYADTVSQGNGTVISGTDCSSIAVGDAANTFVGSDGAGAAIDGQLFDWRLWLDLRTSTEIANNYQLVQTNSNADTLRENMYKSGQHHVNACSEITNGVIFSEANGTIAFTADIPAGMNQSVGTVGGEAVAGTVGEGTYSGLGWSGSIGELHLMFGLGQDYLTFFASPWSGAQGGLVDLSGTSGAPAFVYRMRAIDNGLGEVVYWTTETVDSLGDSYTGPGPLTDVVVSAVICQG